MSVAALWSAALAAAARDDDTDATRLFAEALAARPDDAVLLNSAGNFHAGAGRATEALVLFDRALDCDPEMREAAINRAVVLTRLDRAGEAADDLMVRQTTLAAAPRYWTTRAAAEYADGRHRDAAFSYAEQIRRDPGNLRALHGRARTALDCGDDRAVEWYDAALAITPGDPWLLHGLSQALEAAGDRSGALDLSEKLAAGLPQWIDALELHARLRWAAGDRADFCDHYAAALSHHSDGAAERSWAAMLAGVDRHAAAADILAHSRARIGPRDRLLLDEAVYRGEAGDDDGADAIFAGVPLATVEWQIAAARQALRAARPHTAETLLAEAIAARPDDVMAWSLRGLAWRVMDDPRHDWLHGESAFVQEVSLDLSERLLSSAVATLDALHDRAAMPIGQSVKLGSQTRGALFQRDEPTILAIAEAVAGAIARYRRMLPVADPTHPLLRWKDAPWRIAGSWSIRLNGAGRHAPHVHPEGLLSSAAYFMLPLDDPGLLELGRPPANLRLDLPPLRTIVPCVGSCVLFPSTLFHATRPIAAGRRMTIAFDVASR
ncbi:putative 2OG-Fe(II) oxygenase [Sphingomonas sp. SAFR-052]|uniref:putative 2OG-Fe(II) oxygenase n=1 Tax=Sphingomonas sp. SAFR-052 TaxID=3436867 RepID=UPI003F7F54DC